MPSMRDASRIEVMVKSSLGQTSLRRQWMAHHMQAGEWFSQTTRPDTADTLRMLPRCYAADFKSLTVDVQNWLTWGRATMNIPHPMSWATTQQRECDFCSTRAQILNALCAVS